MMMQFVLSCCVESMCVCVCACVRACVRVCVRVRAGGNTFFLN